MTPGTRFAIATGVLVACAAGGAALINRGRASGRLRGPRNITTKPELQRKLDALRRDIRKLARDGGEGYRDEFLRLRRRLDKIGSDSQGFFPEAVDMVDAVLPELITARDQAAEVRSQQLDDQRRKAHEDYRDEQRARPDYFFLKDKFR